MTKRRNEQAKRRQSAANEASKNEYKKRSRAEAEYRGSIQEAIDSVNERTRAVYGDEAAPPSIGPTYKKNSRKSVNQAEFRKRKD
jgi:hypothetical protein